MPVVLSDVMFAADGTLAFDDHDHSGLWGDVVLVNGVPWPTMRSSGASTASGSLNASSSRSYRPALSNGHPLTVVATDGGMVPVTQPVAAATGTRRPSGTRCSSTSARYAVGAVVDLVNRSNPNNGDYDHTNKIMRFVVTGDDVRPGRTTGCRHTLDIGATRGRTDGPGRRRPRRASATMRVHRSDVRTPGC